MTTPPVSFQALAKIGGAPSSGGYPYQIRGADLDKNFVFATLQLHSSLYNTTTGPGGHAARELKIPAIPAGDIPTQLTAKGGSLLWAETIPIIPETGTYVLGAVGGALAWIETEEC
jgi:hypothetical protein